MGINRIDEINTIKQIENTRIVSKSNEKNETRSNENSNKNNENYQISKKDLELAVDKANKLLFKNNTHLQFRVHDLTNSVMVKIIDDQTGDVLKEIPPEKMLDMVAKLWEIAGIIVDEKR